MVTFARDHGQAQVLDEIVEERRAQDKQWGGQHHDDAHARRDWIWFVDGHLTSAKKAVLMTGDLDEYRKQMLECAALCVAAIESHDRKAAP
jgi:hypothetical protein